ncbi:N-6 DNA methylase [Actinacidiphila bryophytorum]|uniref:N-6 DNA methylase n=1 Tax=Actinacidiphila bryophytorum TaxID=1436133 RepID=UPI0019610BF1|nr:type I restriction-modification system subunit M/S [Actinacidiphila bryophytorum]MBM9435902.1 N-6 DNA methylase [Actinacidiphila bryophytorum]MBN6544139.1 N-6 DNA methylase [Actinacidiphila bryophytorum]
MSNWARRHKDFPAPVRSGDMDLFLEAEIARWLVNRMVPHRQLLDGEPPGTTYADRFSRTSGRRRQAEPKAGGSPYPHVGAEDRKAVEKLMGRLAERVRGPATMADFVNLCLIVMYVRHAEPDRWSRIEKAMAVGQGTQGVQGLLRFLGDVAQETLRRSGDRTDMRGSLLQLEPRSWDDLTAAVRTAAGAGRGAFQLVWESFSAREGLQSFEFCSPVGLASLAAELVLAPGQKATVLDPYMRGGEMLAAAYRHLGDAGGTLYGETLDGRLQAVASLYLLHLGVRPKLTSTRSDRWPPHREHGADVVLTNPPFNMSDAPGPGRRTGDWPYGAPPRGNDNFAWVQYVLGALVPGGRAAVVMPVKAGNSVSAAEREIRRSLIRRGAVECVITLPPHLFSATPVPVSLWLLRRVEQPAREDVLFVDAQELGERMRRRRVLRDIDREAITALVRPWLDGEACPDDAGKHVLRVAAQGLSAVAVARAEIIGEECSLRPADYLGGGHYGAGPDTAMLRAASDDAAERRHRLERGAPGTEHAYRTGPGPVAWDEAVLGDLCEIQAGPSYTRLPATARTRDTGVPLVFPQDLVGGRIAEVTREGVPWETAERFKKFMVLENDIVCVRTGAQQRPALVSASQAGRLLSSNVTRLRLRPTAEVDPLYLHAYLGLRHAREWMSHRAAATAAPSLSSAALGHLPVRFPPMGQQRRCVELLSDLGRRVEAYEEYAAALGRLRGELAEHLLHGSAEPL